MSLKQTEDEILSEIVSRYMEEKSHQRRVTKKKLTLTIDAAILEKARNLDINISALTENVLRTYIESKQQCLNEEKYSNE